MYHQKDKMKRRMLSPEEIDYFGTGYYLEWKRVILTNLYYKVWCLSVRLSSLNVRLTSPPVLKLWDTQGYLWLPYDLTEVIKLIGETFEPPQFFFQNNTLCHSFGIIVSPPLLLAFLPNYCYFYRIIAISNICHPE